MAKETVITEISALARLAAENQQRTLKLFDRTQLASIPHTPENIASAVQTVHMLTEQTRTVLAMTVKQRGMFLCWLKANYAKHGEWETFCKGHFPTIPKRTRCYWMAAYLTEIGEKKPRELPKYDAGELEDRELEEAVDGLNPDKTALAPRKALIAHTEKLQKQIDKGHEQREADRETIDALKAQIKQLEAGGEIREDVADEATRIEHIRNAYWKFVTFWIGHLPKTANRLKLHKALFAELRDEMVDLWSEHIYPRGETRVLDARKAKGGHGG